MEDVSGGQALRDRTGLIFGVWMSQEATVDLMYLLCCGLNLSPGFCHVSSPLSSPTFSLLLYIIPFKLGRYAMKILVPYDVKPKEKPSLKFQSSVKFFIRLDHLSLRPNKLLLFSSGVI